MKGKVKKQAPPTTKPPWADGLKRIYSSVLEEPLPEVFEQLLAKLDEACPDDGKK